MNLSATPYRIDFIGNNPKFAVKTSPFLTEGRRHKRSFSVPSIAAGTFDLHTGEGDYHWIVSSVNKPDNALALLPASTPADVMEQLQAKIIYNYDVNLHYSITAQLRQNDVLLTIEAKAPNLHDAITLGNNATQYTAESTTTGLAQTPKSRYHIVAWFQCADQSTPELHYDDNGGSVTIGTGMLQPFLGLPDIPAYGETIGAHQCPHAAIRTRLLFAESVDGAVGVVKKSDEILLLRGEIEQYCADNNIPDWKSNDSDKLYRSSRLSIFGQDNDATVNTDTETEQYLYVANFTDGDIRNVAILLTTRAADGENTSTAATANFPAQSICRVPVGAAALGIAAKNGLIGYSISLGTTGIVRNFHIVPRPFNARTFLLVNHVGQYESFVFNNVYVEQETSGDRAVTNKSDKYIINDSTRTITARSGMRTFNEINHIDQALLQDDNLLLDGQYAWRISLVPGTFTVVDESADLLEVEMKFSIVEKVNRAPLNIRAISPSIVISRKDNIIK